MSEVNNEIRDHTAACFKMKRMKQGFSFRVVSREEESKEPKPNGEHDIHFVEPASCPVQELERFHDQCNTYGNKNETPFSLSRFHIKKAGCDRDAEDPEPFWQRINKDLAQRKCGSDGLLDAPVAFGRKQGNNDLVYKCLIGTVKDIDK
jgi:hypothetical protein